MFLVLPTVPRNITLVFVNQSAVELRWLPPAITGEQTDVYYDIDCRTPCDNDDDNECVDKECGNDVSYVPDKENLEMAKVMTTNLSSFVNYTFKIYAKNRVSEVAKRRHGVEEIFAAITVRTNGSSKFLIFLRKFTICYIIMTIPSADHLTQMIAIHLICVGSIQTFVKGKKLL